MGWGGADGREEAILVLPEQVTYYLWVPGSQEGGRTVEWKRAVFKGVSLKGSYTVALETQTQTIPKSVPTPALLHAPSLSVYS